jgi:hypothetical protein
MKRLASSFLVVAALLVAGVLPAQAQEEAPTLVSVGTLSVTPAHSAQFGELVAKVVEAAKMSDLDAKYRWAVYQEGNKFRFVTWPENWASLDDQGAWVREVGAGEGGAMMQEAFAEFEELWVTSESHMAGMVEEWSYVPEDGLQAGDHTGAVVFQTWVRPGMAEAYSENTAGIMTLMGEIGFPYPIYGHRVLLGDENLTYFVVLHDGLSDFYGEKSFGAFIEAAGVGEEWAAHFEARNELVYATDTWQSTWRQDMSYLPDDGS